jgi:rhodanese-related sulfurtransferase
LLRIGYFNIKGYNNFGINDWKGETWKPKIVNYEGLKQIPDVTILDVRNKKEWQETGIVENAVTIPLNTLEDRVGELKDRKNIVVHCRTGMRARVAHAILAQNGIDSTVLAESI